MIQTVVERVLIPDATRSSVLVVAGDQPSLPMWSLVDPEMADSIREARTSIGVSSPFLRVVRLDGDVIRGVDFRTLLEFDAPSASWEPLSGFTWLPFADLTPDHLDAGPFEPDVVTWAAELVSARIPPLRPEWARSGWFETTVEWLDAELGRLGRVRLGAVEQLGSWAISSRLAAETDTGRVILKSVPELFAHEPDLTRALAEQHPGSVLRVLATDHTRRCLLMAAFGGAPLGAEKPHQWADGLTAMAEIQKAWIGRRAEADRLGVQDRALEAIGEELESLVTDETASPHLDPADRSRLVGYVPLYRDLIRRLQAGPVPETLIHADFHPGNIQRDGDQLVIYDWSDACWSHPFFDVATFTIRTDDEAAREAMRRIYLTSWSEFADAQTLQQTLAWAGPLTELHLAMTWRRLQDIFEQDHAYPFVDSGTQRHLEWALAATEGLR